MAIQKYCIVAYFEPIPSSEKLLEFGVSGKNYKISKFGKIFCCNDNKKECKKQFIKLVSKMTEYFDNLNIIAIGEQDLTGKTSVFISYFEHLLTVLSKEVAITIHGLGLDSNNTENLSKVVAFEILKSVAINNRVDNGAPYLNDSTEFSHWFVIDENHRQKMVKLYVDKINYYVKHLNMKKSKSKKIIEKITDKRDEIIISILSGIITELTLKIIVNVCSYLHSEEGEVDIITYDIPRKLHQVILSEEIFSTLELSKEIGMNELSLILFLNSLIEPEIIELVDVEKGYYKGTGKIKVPNVMGSYLPGAIEKALDSSIFINDLDIEYDLGKIMKWTPDRNIPDVYEKYFK